MHRVGIGNPCLGHVLPIVRANFRKIHFGIGIEIEILARSDAWVVRANQTGGKKERLFFLLETLEQFDGFSGGFPVRLVGSITLVLYGDEHSVGHSGGFASFKFGGEAVQVEAGVLAGCVGLLARDVVLGRPAGRDALTIGAVDDVTGYPHVKNLTDTRAGESVLLKMFAPGDLLSLRGIVHV